MRILATGLQFPEGPVAMPDGSVLLVEIARETLTRVHPDGRTEVAARVPGGPNGAAVGPNGQVFLCNNGGFSWIREHGTHRPTTQPDGYECGRIEVVDPGSGRVERLYDRCDGQMLRGPNDLVFDAHGGFWFTDLGKRRARDLDWGAVYYARADGSAIHEAAYGILGANGIGLSPDGTRLHVAETMTGRLWSWEVTAPGTLRRLPWPAGPHGGTLLANCGGTTRLDSLAVSASGRVCVAALDRAAVLDVSPDGTDVRAHHFPDMAVTNICFGGPDLRTAYVTLSHEGRLASTTWHEPGLRLEHQDLAK